MFHGGCHICRNARQNHQGFGYMGRRDANQPGPNRPVRHQQWRVCSFLYDPFQTGANETQLPSEHIRCSAGSGRRLCTATRAPVEPARCFLSIYLYIRSFRVRTSTRHSLGGRVPGAPCEIRARKMARWPPPARLCFSSLPFIPIRQHVAFGDLHRLCAVSAL